jgi:8-amino-7-oxononanoate synthase
MFEQELQRLEHQLLLRSPLSVSAYNGPYITVNNRKLLLLCSNDYLGLAGNDALRHAAVSALEHYGFGSGASRLISGTSKIHQELEERIALFKGTEAALLFNTGYAANTGIIPALAESGDVILSDSLNHASIIDGCRLSKALVRVYRHRDVEHAATLLEECRAYRRKLIVTDGVFSMDGDLAPLPELTVLAEQYGALLMVDDAHATGVFGSCGTGTTEHFGLHGRVPIQMGTLGKALGSFGAYVAGSRTLIDYLLHRSRSFIFSTALPPAVCAASLAALDIVENEPERRETLWKNRDRFIKGLVSAGIDVGISDSPIVPVVIGSAAKTIQTAQKLMDDGVYAAAIRPPTVPEGLARIRATIMATHSDGDIDAALSVFAKLKQEGLL